MSFKILAVAAVSASIITIATVAEAGTSGYGRYSGNHYGHNDWQFQPWYHSDRSDGYHPYNDCEFSLRKSPRTGASYWWKNHRRC